MRSALWIAALTLAGSTLHAGAQTPAPAAPSGTKTLAATMSVYAFPKAGQAADQQSKDEAACYDWAAQNTGTDPFELSKKAEQDNQQAQQAKQQAQQAGKGAGAKGAVKGAAAGALIGEIADDDAGKGAAYGAAAGAVAGRHRKRKGEAQAAQQIDQQNAQNQQSLQQQMDGFKKAFSACLEAKNYMVKF